MSICVEHAAVSAGSLEYFHNSAGLKIELLHFHFDLSNAVPEF